MERSPESCRCVLPTTCARDVVDLTTQRAGTFSRQADQVEPSVHGRLLTPALLLSAENGGEQHFTVAAAAYRRQLENLRQRDAYGRNGFICNQ